MTEWNVVAREARQLRKRHKVSRDTSFLVVMLGRVIAMLDTITLPEAVLILPEDEIDTLDGQAETVPLH